MTDLFIAWFQQMLLWRLQLCLLGLLGVFGGRVRGRLSRRRALVLFGGAGLVRQPRGRAVRHRQLRVRLLLRLLLLRRLRLPLFGLAAAEAGVRRVQQEVPALRPDLRGRGGGRGVDGALGLEVLRRGDGRLADGVDCGGRRGQRGGRARPSGRLRDDSHHVLLLERLLRGHNQRRGNIFTFF